MKQGLAYQIRYAYRAFVRALADELAPHGITTSQWAVLRALWQEDGLTQVELANRLMVEKASLTAVLQSLATAGLISRARNARDKRKVNISLTAAGRRLKQRLLPLGGRINQRATRGIAASEVGRLENLLSKVQGNLKG